MVRMGIINEQEQKCCIIWDVEGHNEAVRHNFPNVARSRDVHMTMVMTAFKFGV